MYEHSVLERNIIAVIPLQIDYFAARCRSSPRHREESTSEAHENSCRNRAWSSQTSSTENSEQNADAGDIAGRLLQSLKLM